MADNKKFPSPTQKIEFHLPFFNKTTNKGKPERNSSIELFRIIATLSVLIVHFNGWFIGGLPSKLDFNSFDWHWGQFLIGAASCVCVNLFIIISGYFGVKFKISSFVHIGLLLLGIFIPLHLIGFLLSHSFDLRLLLSQIWIITRSGYFIQCYLMLLFLSPLLNSFVKGNSRRSVLIWTLLLWSIEIWFGCIKEAKSLAFMNGYSFIHFVLIYMMARCVRLYQEEMLKCSKWIWFGGYFVSTCLLWLMLGSGIHLGYANPINIISSFCLFMPFLYYYYYSKPVNWIAKSTLAVYVIQVTYPVFGYLCDLDTNMLRSMPYGLYLLASIGVIMLVFMACVLYDKVLWKFFSPMEKIISSKIGEKNYYSALFNS